LFKAYYVLFIITTVVIQ